MLAEPSTVGKPHILPLIAVTRMFLNSPVRPQEVRLLLGSDQRTVRTYWERIGMFCHAKLILRIFLCRMEPVVPAETYEHQDPYRKVGGNDLSNSTKHLIGDGEAYQERQADSGATSLKLVLETLTSDRLRTGGGRCRDVVYSVDRKEKRKLAVCGMTSRSRGPRICTSGLSCAT